MKIFALQTNCAKLQDDVMHGQCICILRKHAITLVPHSLKFIFLSIVFLSIVEFLSIPEIAWIPFFIFFLIFPLVRGVIDWKYDRIFVGEHEITIVDQSSIFSQNVKRLDTEKVLSVTGDSQWFDLFNFGTITLRLHEGEATNGETKVTYIRDYKKAISEISRIISKPESIILDDEE